MKKRETGKHQGSTRHKRTEPAFRTEHGAWDLIARKAYELYERRGRQDGYALEDWLEAEAITKSEGKKFA